MVHLTVGSYEGFIQMPLPIGVGSQLLGAFLSDLGNERPTNSITPNPVSFMAHLNPTFMQHIFHIPKRKWKPARHHYLKTSNLRRCFEIAKRTGFCCPAGVRRLPYPLQSSFF